MLANLHWSSGPFADGTGSELARATGGPLASRVWSLRRHMPYSLPYSLPYTMYLPYTCTGNIITSHKSVAPQRPPQSEALLRWDNRAGEVKPLHIRWLRLVGEHENLNSGRSFRLGGILVPLSAALHLGTSAVCCLYSR